jgi:hypothetical protein
MLDLALSSSVILTIVLAIQLYLNNTRLYAHRMLRVSVVSTGNGNLGVSVYFLKAKQWYTVRKMEEDNWYSIH